MRPSTDNPESLDRRALAMAGLLLAKAGSSEVDAEAAALAERCYRLLARVITDYESAATAAGRPVRRRERRHLVDRRAGRLRAAAAGRSAGQSGAPAGASPGAWRLPFQPVGEAPVPHVIDVRA